MLEIVSADRSIPSVATRWYWMSRIVILPAYRLMIITPETIHPLNPLGHQHRAERPLPVPQNVKGHVADLLTKVLGVNPFLKAGDARPAGSPTWAIASSIIRSDTSDRRNALAETGATAARLKSTVLSVLSESDIRTPPRPEEPVMPPP